MFVRNRWRLRGSRGLTSEDWKLEIADVEKCGMEEWGMAYGVCWVVRLRKDQLLSEGGKVKVRTMMCVCDGRPVARRGIPE